MRTLITAITFCFIFGSVHGQLLNGGFESWEVEFEDSIWTNSFVDSALQSIPLEWKTELDLTEIGVLRTTDAAEGRYAVVTYSWYVYMLTTIIQQGELEMRPSTLTGIYKYHLKDFYSDTTDHATISIKILDADSIIIGNGMIMLDTIQDYTKFILPIFYNDNSAASNYVLSIKNANDNCSIFSGTCKYLYLDNLSFGYTTSTSADIDLGMNVYPNPSNGNLNFSLPFKKCEVYNLQGQLIHTFSNNTQVSLPISPNVYIIKVTDLNQTTTIHRIVKR